MLCTTCKKESKNLRVCPFCFTPYPAEPAPGSRPSIRMSVPAGVTGAAGAGKSPPTKTRAFVMRQSPLVRWSALGIVVVALLWAMTSTGDAGAGAGRKSASVIATPLQRDEALAVIRQTRETALVDVQQDEVFVSYPAATFPVLEAGQLALAQQFSQADGILEGRTRRIFFYNPNGKLFAQSDATRGVILVR
jgi:hypothetical protein